MKWQNVMFAEKALLCPLCFYIFVNCKNKQKYLLLFVRIIPILILHTTRCCAIIDLLYKIYAFKELKVTLYIKEDYEITKGKDLL